MKHTIILLALLAVSVGCRKQEIRDEFKDGCMFRRENGYLEGGMPYEHYIHSERCPNPIHYSDTCCKHK